MRQNNAERAINRAHLIVQLRQSLQVAAIIVPLIAGLIYLYIELEFNPQQAMKTGKSKVDYGKVLHFYVVGKNPSSRMIIELKDGRMAAFTRKEIPGLFQVGERVRVTYVEDNIKRIHVYRVEPVKQDDFEFNRSPG